MSERAEQLLSYTREAYDLLIAHLPADRGACYELSALAQIISRAMGVPCALCRGYRVLPGPVHDAHGWLELPAEGLILQSPRRGEVELLPIDRERFVARWRAGAAPLPLPPGRCFKVERRR